MFVRESEKFSRWVGGPEAAMTVAGYLHTRPNLERLTISSDKGGTGHGSDNLADVPDLAMAIQPLLEGRPALRHRIEIEATFDQPQIQTVGVVVSRLRMHGTVAGEDQISVTGTRQVLQRTLRFSDRARTIRRIVRTLLSVTLIGMTVAAFVLGLLHT